LLPLNVWLSFAVFLNIDHALHLTSRAEAIVLGEGNVHRQTRISNAKRPCRPKRSLLMRNRRGPRRQRSVFVGRLVFAAGGQVEFLTGDI
jgi:hypothetical protein